MAQVTSQHSDSHARDRLEKELQDESQRIKEACLQLTDIDPEVESSRYEALVRAMVDALDRQAALDKLDSSPSTAAQQPDLFNSIGVKPGALNALIAQLRSLSAGDETLSSRFQVLNDYVSSNLPQNPEDAMARSSSTAINWEHLADRIDALRQRLHRETEEDRMRSRQRQSTDSTTAKRIPPAPPSDSH
jgi:hypothetical protein